MVECVCLAILLYTSSQSAASCTQSTIKFVFPPIQSSIRLPPSRLYSFPQMEYTVGRGEELGVVGIQNVECALL